MYADYFRLVLVFGMAAVLARAESSSLSIDVLPKKAFVGDTLTYRIGSNSTSIDYISSPEPGLFSISLSFPVSRPESDLTDVPVEYSIAWQQPNGARELPENTLWNTTNNGDLYFMPAPKHVGTHLVTVTARVGQIQVSKSIRLILNAPINALLAPVVPAADGEIKGYYYKRNYTDWYERASLIGTTLTETNSEYRRWPATHCAWYGDPAGSGGSYNPRSDYGVPPIGPFGTPRTVAIALPGSYQTTDAYSRLARQNAYFGWNSQSPSFSSTLNFSRFVADVTHLIGAKEGRYPQDSIFRPSWFRFWSQLTLNTRRRLIRQGHYASTYQSALRHSLFAAPAAEYLTNPKAHPVVFQNTYSTVVDEQRLDTFARGLNQTDALLPIVTLAVVKENFSIPMEHVHTVDRSIARTWRSLVRDRHIRVSARQSFVPNGRIERIVWSVLENGGDPQNVLIVPLNPRATIVDIFLRFPNQPIKVAAFAQAANRTDELLKYSSPAFLSFSNWSSLHEPRGADIDNSTAADGSYIRLGSEYANYSLYDKREYRQYDALGRILRRSGGRRGDKNRFLRTLTKVGDYKEDVFNTDGSFVRSYAWSGGSWKFDYSSDGARIIERDAQRRATQTDFLRQGRYTTIEQSYARLWVDYPGSDRRVTRMEEVDWVTDPLHPTDHRYDLMRVRGIDIFVYDPADPNRLLQIDLSVPGSTATVIAKIVEGFVEGYRPGSAVVSAKVPYSGELEDLPDALGTLRALVR